MNPFQQSETAGQHTKHSKKHFTLSKTQQFIHKKYHNQMSNLNKYSYTGSHLKWRLLMKSSLEHVVWIDCPPTPYEREPR